MIRRIAVQAGLLALGAAVGMLAAFSIAHVIQLRLGRIALASYAQRLEASGMRLAEEEDETTNEVLDANLPFCSDAEIALMRNLTYRSEDVKEIERTRNGKVECTADLGKLAHPAAVPAPSLAIPYMNVYAFADLPFATDGQAFIVERDGTAVVMNPDAFKNLDEPPLRYSGLLFDRENMRVLRGFGHAMPLTNSEIAHDAFLERDGVFYRAQCAKHAMFCVVAAESRADMLARSRWLTGVLYAGGAVAGAALALILILSYRRQQTLDHQLRRAIRREDLTLVYQPVVDLETGVVVAAEALVRWVNEAGESIRPDIFVAVAEERGFVSQITRLVMKRAIEELGDLLASGRFRLTLNITADDLAAPEFFTQLEQTALRSKIDPSIIGLELTERSTADSSMAIKAIAQLIQAGHPVYIDDFGTGYSSLAYLHQLAASAIKIDRAFTKTIGTASVTASVVPQILDMAAQLNLMVVVEGIETEEQREYFRQAGAGILGQGWLFGRPVRAAQLRARIVEQPQQRSSAA